MKFNPKIKKYNLIIAFSIITVIITIFCSCTDPRNSTSTGEEESRTMLALNESYDKVRNGARLVLNYDAQNNSFEGFVENTTNNTLKQVRVEVHLSNGTELGPTIPEDLDPGEKIDINLKATDKEFNGWTAHPEVGESGSGEHGNDEGDNEHGNEGDSSGEHSGGNSC